MIYYEPVIIGWQDCMVQFENFPSIVHISVAADETSSALGCVKENKMSFLGTNVDNVIDKTEFQN